MPNCACEHAPAGTESRRRAGEGERAAHAGGRGSRRQLDMCVLRGACSAVQRAAALGGGRAAVGRARQAGAAPRSRAHRTARPCTSGPAQRTACPVRRTRSAWWRTAGVQPLPGAAWTGYGAHRRGCEGTAQCVRHTSAVRRPPARPPRQRPLRTAAPRAPHRPCARLPAEAAAARVRASKEGSARVCALPGASSSAVQRRHCIAGAALVRLASPRRRWCNRSPCAAAVPVKGATCKTRRRQSRRATPNTPRAPRACHLRPQLCR